MLSLTQEQKVILVLQYIMYYYSSIFSPSQFSHLHFDTCYIQMERKCNLIGDRISHLRDELFIFTAHHTHTYIWSAICQTHMETASTSPPTYTPHSCLETQKVHRVLYIQTILRHWCRQVQFMLLKIVTLFSQRLFWLSVFRLTLITTA